MSGDFFPTLSCLLFCLVNTSSLCLPSCSTLSPQLQESNYSFLLPFPCASRQWARAVTELTLTVFGLTWFTTVIVWGPLSWKLLFHTFSCFSFLLCQMRGWICSITSSGWKQKCPLPFYSVTLLLKLTIVATFLHKNQQLDKVCSIILWLLCFSKQVLFRELISCTCIRKLPEMKEKLSEMKSENSTRVHRRLRKVPDPTWQSEVLSDHPHFTDMGTKPQRG